MEERALQDLTFVQGNRVARRPASGKGRFGELDKQTKTGSALVYPYPRRLSPALAVRPPAQQNAATPAQPEPTAEQRSHLTLKEAFNILMGIGIANLALFVWIFRVEAGTHGSVVGIAFIG